MDLRAKAAAAEDLSKLCLVKACGLWTVIETLSDREVLEAAVLRYDVGGLCNGILAGVVSITAGCGNVTSLSAIGAAVAWILSEAPGAHFRGEMQC